MSVDGRVRSSRRGRSFVSLLPDMPGIRCPWDLAAKVVSDDDRCRAVAESAMVSFVRRGGSASTCLAVSRATDLLPTMLELVRVPSSHVGMPNYIGVTVVPDGPGLRRGVWFESFNELHHLLDLMIDGGSRSVVTQPAPFEWCFPKGGVREHTPDILVTDADERPVLVDVTRAQKVTDDAALLTILALTAATCAALGWGYEVRTELPPQRCRNLRFLAGFRDELPAATEVLEAVRSASRFDELERALGGGDSRAKALRAVANGAVHLDLDQGIAPHSAVSTAPVISARPWLVPL